jgi:L,D-transpeptidase ErfK/SrfK
VGILAAVLLAASPGGFRGAYPGGNQVIGFVQGHVVAEDESLIEIARDYDLGYNAIVEANPTLDPFVPGTGAGVSVPSAWVLPAAASPGTVVVNLSEMRLYIVSAPGATGTSWVVTFPIGIGSEGTETPLGSFTVIARQKDPVWRVPPSIRREEPDLPAVVPAGPDNPLGTHALRLSAPGVLIHGTDKPWAVGRKASHGCLRLYPEDIPWFYRLVRVDTPVRIVREPVKVGVRDGRIQVEVHQDEDAKLDLPATAARILGERGLLDQVNPDALGAALDMRSGIPTDVTR